MIGSWGTVPGLQADSSAIHVALCRLVLFPQVRGGAAVRSPSGLCRLMMPDVTPSVTSV